MNDGWQSREVHGEGDGGNSGDGAAEDLEKLLLANVQNLRGESVALVVNLGNSETVGEGRDVQHVEKGGLGRTNLATGLDELQIGGNFDGTTSNLGGDTESLEERGLARFHTGVSSRDPDIGRGKGTSTSRSGDLVGKDLVTDVLQVAIGEDETNVALDMRQETLVLGSLVEEDSQGSANLKFRREKRSDMDHIRLGNKKSMGNIFTMVFLPIRTTASLRRACRISCIC